jgi:PAS domain S-box-containing protein
MLGFLEHDSAEELMASGDAWRECFTPESLEVLERELSRRPRGIASSYEVEVVGRWGRFTRMMVYGAPIFAPDGALDSLMGIFIDVTEKRREEEALRQSEQRLRVAARFSNDLIYEWDIPTGRLEWFGPIDERLGFTDGDIPRTVEAWEALIHPDDAPRVKAAIERHFAGLGHYDEEYRVLTRSGAWRHWSDRGAALFDAAGRPGKWIGACIDLTETKRAEENLRVREEQLRQSQKLEAVGRLAGGIAHDFNNLLAAIMGYCELMLLRLEPRHPCRREVGEILGSSDRAAGLIRQLLAFSRQEIPQPKVINPNFVLASMESMLRHLLEETIDLRLRIDAGAGRVRIDPVQFEQVIMNLVVNARDAMPGGGTLVLSTGNVELDGDLQGAYGRVRPGPYVRVSVADSGQGVPEEHLPHIFDPFYTTKDRGKGSGLGLSTVYGIVTQNQGCVVVETGPDRGSIFSFFLPQTEEEPEVESEIRRALRASSVVPRTVLVVEDDDEVRRIVRELLSRQGFLVLEARNGAEALALAEKYDQPLHLLLTDVVMPGMGGRELAAAMNVHIPGLRVLFMSGYTQDASFREQLYGGKAAYIQKPFTLTTLMTKIREVLIEKP